MGGLKGARRDYLIYILLIVITLAVFWRVTDLEFNHFDDNVFVTDNQHVLSGMTGENIRWAFTATRGGTWMPLVWLSYLFDHQVGDIDPQVYHLTNLALHLVNVILLFVVLFELTRSRWRSAFVAALFAIHPLHVESVAWIAERKDVLSTLFWMLAMLAYVRYRAHPRPVSYIFVMLAFFGGLMSKPMLVSLPFVLLFIDFWPLHRMSTEAIAEVCQSAGKLAREKAPLFAVSAIVCIVAVVAQRQARYMSSLTFIPLGVRLPNALVAYVAYISKMLWPRNLCALYPHPINHLPVWQVMVSGVILACITLVAIRLASSRPYVLMGWLW